MPRTLSTDAALAVLGLEPTATLPEARRANRARARQVHPDRVEASARARAATQMAELNEAWHVVERHLRARDVAASARPAGGGPEPSNPMRASSPGAAAHPTPPPPSARPRPAPQPRPRPERPAPTPRGPGAQECTICGWWPAAPLRLRWTTGLILVWSVTTVVQTLCRRCGDSVYADYADLQARSLVRGWWGLLAPVANLVNLARNAAAIGAHRRLPEAEYRSPEVRTPSLWPSVATPVTSRPGPLLATTTAVGILVLFLVVIA